MTYRLELSEDEDRWWVMRGEQRIGFIRYGVMVDLGLPSEFGPQELVPVVKRRNERRNMERRRA